MAKVILISPPYVDLYGRLNKAAGRYFPLGLGYIASYLRRYGNHDVKLYEPEAEGLTYADLGEIIKNNAPDVIGLTCSTPNFFRAIELAKIGRKNSKAKIVIGGVHASALPEFIIDNYSGLVDCVIKGEGEITMLELVNAYQDNSGIEKIKGIIYKRGDKISCNEFRPFIDNLDSIPFPARDLIPQKLFMPNLHNARYKRCFSILTSRGCPFDCSFCASRIVSGKKYRIHSAEYIIEEIEMLKKNYDARQLIITDDTFTINRERLEKICRKMIDKRLRLSWFCFSQVNTVDREILKLMKKAGCYSIGFGIESSDKETLKKMGKPIELTKALEAVKIANETGLKTQAFYIFGTAGETIEQIKNTIRFSKRAFATISFFNMLVPYPGTREFGHFFSDMPLGKINWENFVAVGERCVLKNSNVSSREIEGLMAKAYFQYYSNPLRIIHLMRHIKTFYELSNYIKGGLSLLTQMFIWSKKMLRKSSEW